MRKKLNASGPGGPRSSCHSKASPALANKGSTSTKPKALRVSSTSQRVIEKTSVKRREAMKALANR